MIDNRFFVKITYINEHPVITYLDFGQGTKNYWTSTFLFEYELITIQLKRAPISFFNQFQLKHHRHDGISNGQMLVVYKILSKILSKIMVKHYFLI